MNLKTQLAHLYCDSQQDEYVEFLIQPVGQIDNDLIAPKKTHLNHIAATFGLKYIHQIVLMQKICTLSGHNHTRHALFKYDKLIFSIYVVLPV
jgi:hypothetical protein